MPLQSICLPGGFPSIFLTLFALGQRQRKSKRIYLFSFGPSSRNSYSNLLSFPRKTTRMGRKRKKRITFLHFPSLNCIPFFPFFRMREKGVNESRKRRRRRR